jgi:hypothetical protein
MMTETELFTTALSFGNQGEYEIQLGNLLTQHGLADIQYPKLAFRTHYYNCDFRT